MVSNGNHREQALIPQASANDGQVARALVYHQQEILFGVEANEVGCLPHGNEEFRERRGIVAASDTPDDPAGINVHGGDAVGGGVGYIEKSRIGRENAARWGVPQHGKIADLVRLRVDDLQAVRFGGDDVEFAAVGLEDHVARLACQLQIRQQNIAAQVDN